MRIADLDTAHRALVVAEIGNNHEGRIEVARELVRQAAEAGADAVKFQTFDPDHYVSRSDAARHARLCAFRLTPRQFAELADLARSLGLAFISTPFDLGSADLLAPLVDAYKIASGDNTFYPLIARAADTGKPLIVSCGLSDLGEITRTVEFVQSRWRARQHPGQLAMLHCVSAYPTPPEEANVHAVRTLRERFDCCVGYSDHTLGTEAAVLAVALGARVVEKHFTLDRHYSEFRDHQISADPAEMAELVRRVRLVSTLLGDGAKRPQPSEAAGRDAFRRSIVAAADLPAGHRLTASDLTWIRPGGGLPPGAEDRLLGRALLHPVHFGDRLTPSDVTAEPTPAASAAPGPVTTTRTFASGATAVSNRPPAPRSNQHASIP